MTSGTELYRWWIVDEVTGERVLTLYKLTKANAALAFTDAKPNLDTREFRLLPSLEQDPWGASSSPSFDGKPLE